MLKLHIALVKSVQNVSIYMYFGTLMVKNCIYNIYGAESNAVYVIWYAYYFFFMPESVYQTLPAISTEE